MVYFHYVASCSRKEETGTTFLECPGLPRHASLHEILRGSSVCLIDLGLEE